ncbi:glycosyltransferase family 4 protein [Microbacterium pumilum]|uniref:Glycosyltransferase family 4 protein n=1 Tax=Microbacterium pumilum TaxID=344165 RepID=A0ABN2S6C1_9MICO
MTDAELRAVSFIVPSGFDDPQRASGGNVYDRRVSDGLSRLGWTVRMSQVHVDDPSTVHSVLSQVSDGELVLIDGLIAGRAPAAVEIASLRLPVVVLAHMASGAFEDADPALIEGERRSLRSARQVIATSDWTRSELVRRRVVAADRIIVATPGADDAPMSTGTSAGGALLCVGVVAPHKGQDTLVEALATLCPDHEWTCTIAGSLDTRPDFAEQVERLATMSGIRDRVTMPGVLAADELDRAYRGADLLVAPSRSESYGMVIADALRRGIPVVASDVGGIPQTVASSRAAILVPPNQPKALSDALRRWMVDPALRARLAADARRAGSHLPRWSDTVARIAQALAGVR